MTQPWLDPIWLRVMAKALVLPPIGPMLVALVGIALVTRFPRTGKTLATAGVTMLLLLSTPAAGGFIVRWLDSTPALDLRTASEAQAIVILGGGTRRNAAEYGGDTVGRLTLERVRYGARIARSTGLPVMVTGGVVLGGTSEASLMQEVLEKELGVPVQFKESQSRNTHQNAKMSAAILRAAGIKRIVLVLHSFDVRRARAEFNNAGIEVLVAPTGIPSNTLAPADFLPTVSGLEYSYYALYEVFANIWMWLN
jgi:uncharacterized SAM-binding protein YcdF (DUF218 family)